MIAHPRRVGALLGLTALALAGAAIGYIYEHAQPGPTLDADGCPPTPAGTVLAIIDRTESWPREQTERISATLLARAERMQKHERLVLHIITARPEDSAAPPPVAGQPHGFRRCKPTAPTINPVVDNERFVRAALERFFLSPLTAAVAELTPGDSAPTSPLLEALEVISWSPHWRPDVPRRTLVLYSDLLIHTREHSQLSGPLQGPCALLAFPVGRRLAARNWSGVRVVLEYIRNPRDAARQGPDHLATWARLLYLIGVAEVFDGPLLIANTAPSCPPPAPRAATITRKP